MKPITQPKQSIGIFDSGIGGLTVAQAILTHLPYENIIYFGDTSHMPYGDKSASAIQSYALKIAQFLLEQNCKLILIACHSASTAAFETVRNELADKAIVMNVVDPVMQLLRQKYPRKRIGLIGTRQTVNSHIYHKKIENLNVGISLFAHATNLLASAIEEFGDHDVINNLLKVYLAHPNLQNIDALVLACTHYHIVKQKILNYYTKPIEIIDPSDVVAHAVKQKLTEHHLLNENGQSQKHFYVSDYTDSFALHAKLFFNQDITLKHYPLWENLPST